MKYLIYDLSGGEIVQIGWGPDDETTIPPDGMAVLVIAADADAGGLTHYVADGALAAYTPEQRATKAAIPNGPTRWRNDLMAWEDLRTLDQAQADKWDEIKAARDAAEFGGFTWDDSPFDSDAISQSRIQGAAQLATLAMLASEVFSIDWTCADNAVRALSGADMIAVGTAMGTHIGTVHAIGRTLRAAIDAAESAEALTEIVWPT